MGRVTKICCLSFAIVVFFLTTLWLAYHHHDLNFTYATCSLCKVKGSLSTNAAKTTIDKPCQVGGSSLLAAFILAVAGKAPVDNLSIYRSCNSHPWSNKAPPA